MGKWFRQFEALIWAATLAIASLAFMYTSFATKEYVDQKHQSVVGILQDIKTAVEKIDGRTYELAREKKQR